jgi:hypothetical protein
LGSKELKQELDAEPRVEALAEESPLLFVFLNLDHFKGFNHIFMAGMRGRSLRLFFPRPPASTRKLRVFTNRKQVDVIV